MPDSPELPMSDDSKAQIESTITGFFQDLGAKLDTYAEDQVVIALDLLPRHMNNASQMHGGVMATLMDAAMGLCGTYSPTAEDRQVAITLSMNVNFTSPAVAGQRVRAVARCRSKGHKIFMATCDLLDEQGKLIAFGEGVFKRGALRRELP